MVPVPAIRPMPIWEGTYGRPRPLRSGVFQRESVQPLADDQGHFDVLGFEAE
jgi:hypothetical protein